MLHLSISELNKQFLSKSLLPSSVIQQSLKRTELLSDLNIFVTVSRSSNTTSKRSRSKVLKRTDTMAHWTVLAFQLKIISVPNMSRRAVVP